MTHGLGLRSYIFALDNFGTISLTSVATDKQGVVYVYIHEYT